ncbi:MAG: 16S rRNA (guanine(966)-N(2))-methyltransferase RsmD [Actinomycetia bacterium]|nr:16S rRNA (guanine(966)-N(2))-methyltransferase RsmD [Actinomycetes bacterium]
MTRIIAGAAKGRRLQVPSAQVRPTSDRVREAIFNTVSTLVAALEREDVLDLFAGTGALGLEALSRGARSATFVEVSGAVAEVLRSNVAAVGCGGEVLLWDVLGSGPLPPLGASLVFLDPPYDTPETEISGLLTRLLVQGVVGSDAIVILEGPRAWIDWQWPVGFTAIRQRDYGGTSVWYGAVASQAPVNS